MMTANEWIKHLKMQEHPEGGWYKETYRSSEIICRKHLPLRFNGDRSISTAIYFLLESNNFSAFHRIKQDEIWHFYCGSVITLHVIDPKGNYDKFDLGIDPIKKQQPQLTIDAGCFFAAEIEQLNNFALVGCTTAPGFDFADFEMPDRATLLQKYPQHKLIIMKLTR